MKMSTQITLEYLSRLLNRPITEGVEMTLSSAQRSRVHGWLTKNQILFNESALTGRFTVDQLLGDINFVSTQSQTELHDNLSSHAGMGNFQIGVDIQRVDELFPQGLPLDPKADQGLLQIFTPSELSYAQSKNDTDVTLTGIFCAKEAILKASNLTINLNEIEVLPDESGRPQSIGYLLSISHSGNYAICVAVLKTKQFCFADVAADTDADADADTRGTSLIYSASKQMEASYFKNVLNIRLIDFLIFLMILFLIYK